MKINNVVIIFFYFLPVLHNGILLSATARMPDLQAFFYTSLAKKINPYIYEALLTCTPQCFREAPNECTEITIVSHQSYPLINIPASKTWFQTTSDDLSKIFHTWYDLYKKTSTYHLPERERNHFLKIIKKIAPKLHAEFELLGDEVFQHFRRNKLETQCSTGISPINGLPTFRIGSKISSQSQKWQFFIFGHEIGHYALEHPSIQPISHALLEDSAATNLTDTPFLLFKDTFKKAQNRVREHEADRFSILILGNNPRSAISWVAASAREFEQLYGRSKDPHKDTFRETHPADGERIKHLRSLQKEIDLQKAHGKKLQEPDWKTLVQLYRENK